MLGDVQEKQTTPFLGFSFLGVQAGRRWCGERNNSKERWDLKFCSNKEQNFTLQASDNKGFLNEVEHMSILKLVVEKIIGDCLWDKVFKQRKYKG